jgi:hypothetical protein
LFALRDRLRRIRIEHPLFAFETDEMMELRINGCIDLVPKASLYRLVRALFAGSYSQEENARAKKMQEIIRNILDSQGTKSDTRPYDNEILAIERETMMALRASFIYNSPLVSALIMLVARFRPNILGKIEPNSARSQQHSVTKSLVRVEAMERTRLGIRHRKGLHRRERVDHSMTTGRMKLLMAFTVAFTCYAQIIAYTFPEECVPTMIVHYALR